MTREEYAMLRSIAVADGVPGPNFDPALLTELLDVHDAVTVLLSEWGSCDCSRETIRDLRRLVA